MTVIAICLFAVWLLLSALYQLKVKRVEALRARDTFSLIPNWSFFAPRPGTVDYHLLFRDCDAAGKLARWHELPLADPRTVRGAVWNPQKRNKKALSDAVRGLASMSRTYGSQSIHISIPYIATLNYISSLPRKSVARATQFMILQSDGYFSKQDPQLVFISRVHWL